MAKINLDKYYTPFDLAEYCVKKTKEIIGEENITEWLEPSAGAGVFLPYLDNNYLAFDIEPEAENIEQKNYLELDLPYFKGRCVIGNPPFGHKADILFRKFYDKATEQADYISFILPLSQYKNTRYLYKFDLVYSEILKPTCFSGVELKCVFNIYKRPESGINKQKRSKLKAITIYREDSKKFKDCIDFDLRMCYMGSAGKILNEGEKYAAEYKIIVNDAENKQAIITALKNANWKDFIGFMTKPKIQQFHIIEYLREQIPQLV